MVKTALVILIMLMIPSSVLAQTGGPFPVDGLANFQVVLGTNDITSPETEQEVTFTLPSDSLPIRRIDHIRIYYQYFSDLTLPTLVHGDYSGTPVMSIDDVTIDITGIRVEPGATITIGGIRATNPSQEDRFQVVLYVTDGPNLGIVKNIASTIASINRANVAITASIEAELGGLRITGFTSPYAFLLFSEDGAVIGTDVANMPGYFAKSFSALQPTTHNISLYAVDSLNLVTSPIVLSVYTQAFVQTTISNLLLSPTIQLSASTILEGGPLHASGSAYPGSQITLFSDAPLRTYAASASADGLWNYSITDTADYVLGDYRLYAMAQTSQGIQSLMSPSLLFSVRGGYGSGTSCGDITQGDLNCDGNINLQDFSILMFYWGSFAAEADINGDGVVNLQDFSIMMFWWGT